MASGKLTRSESNKFFGGVCGGLGEFFDVDPTWIRILFVALAFISVGFMLLVYIALWLIVPASGAVEGEAALSENVEQVVETTGAAIESGAEKASSLGEEVTDAVSSAVSKATEGTDAAEDGQS